MERYSKIENKFKREIVLLKAKPCSWGKCSFCDYISDNSNDEKEINLFNREILKKVTGEFSRLEVINSASVFDFPLETLEEIRKVADDKNIEELVFESHWIFRNRLSEIRKFFGDKNIFFKIGVETFDDDFRNKVLKKGMIFKSVKEVSSLFDSPCLLVCIQGQTKEMIRRDIDIALKNFKRCTINIFNNNSTNIKRDDELYDWFVKEYGFLKDEDRVELLMEITDFGVG